MAKWWEEDPIDSGDWWKSDPVDEPASQTREAPALRGLDQRPIPSSATPAMPEEAPEPARMDEPDTPETLGGTRRASEIREMLSMGNLSGPARERLESELAILDRITPEIARGVAEAEAETAGEADPFAGEGMGELAARRGQQFARGATEVAASVPESLAIGREIEQRDQRDRAREAMQGELPRVREIRDLLDGPGAGNLSDARRQELQGELETLQRLAPQIAKPVATREITPARETPLYQRGDAIRQASEDTFGAPDPRDASFWGKVAEGGGNMAAMALSSIAAGVVAGPGAGMAVGGATGASLNRPALYKEAIEAGADEETALEASQWGTLIGASEIIPITRALKLLPASMRREATGTFMRKFVHIAKSSGEEAAQEYLATVANNVVAQKLYDPDRGWTEGALESAAVGAVLGGGMGAVGSAFDRNPKADSTPPPRSPLTDNVREEAPLTDADRASPLSPYLGRGKKIVEDATNGQPRAPRINPVAPAQPVAPELDTNPTVQSAPSAPEAPRAPTGLNQAPAAPASVDDFDLPEGAVPASDLFGDEVEELDSGASVRSADPSRETNSPYSIPTGGSLPPSGPDTAPVAPEREAENAAAEAETAEAAGVERRNITTLTERDVPNIATDAKTFQYKDGGDENGVTERLRGIKKWEPTRAGLAIVYEYEDGRRVIADGHQRLGLAKKLAAEGQEIDLPVYVIREKDGHSPSYARRVAAEKNIAEGSGTALDAAKVLRESGRTIEDANLPPASAMARDADGIAKLSDDAFGMVVNEVANENHGALVGKLVEDKARHRDVLATVAKVNPSNRTQAEFIVREAIRDEVTEQQDSLFGIEEVKQNLVEERAKVLDRTLKDLGREISTFKVLKDRGDTITEAGNVLNEEANSERLDESGRARATLMKAATTKGPISDALSEAARAVRDGGKVSDAARKFADAVRRAEAGEPVAVAGPQAGRPGDGDGQAQADTGQAQGLSTEQTEAGEQTVIPGTEQRRRVSQKTIDSIQPVNDGGRFAEPLNQNNEARLSQGGMKNGRFKQGIVLEQGKDGPRIKWLTDKYGDQTLIRDGKVEATPEKIDALLNQFRMQFPDVDWDDAAPRPAQDAPPAGGLFDEGARAQTDLFSDPAPAPSAAPKAEDAPRAPTRPGAQGYAYKLADSLTDKQQKNLAKWRGAEVGQLVGELDAVARRAEADVRARGLDIRDLDAAGRDANGQFVQMGFMVREAEGLAADLLDRAAEKKSGDLDPLEWDEDTGELVEDQEQTEAYAARLFLDTAEAQSPPINEASTGNPRPETVSTDLMDEAKVFAPPKGKTVNIDVTQKKGDRLDQEEASRVVQSWRETAAEIGATIDNSNKVIISLFDYTGAWAQPWRDAGYKVVQHDIKAGSDVIFDGWITEQIEEMRAEGMEIYGVLSACPCTTYAGSGARWWKDRHDKEDVAELVKVFGPKAPMSGAKSAVEFNNMLVDESRNIVRLANPTGFHALENPIGRIQEKAAMPDPAFRFQPHNFGDPYTKRTQIWGDVQTDLPVADVDPTDGSKMQSQYRGDDPLGKEKRSTTPSGFAYAFFMANDPNARKVKDQRPEAADTKAPKAQDERNEETPGKGSAGGREQIGTNAKGKPLYEDENGVRSYSDNGVRVSESVTVEPGKALYVDPAQRGKDYLTAEEYEQFEADQKVRAEFAAIDAQRERDQANAEPVDMAEFEAAGMTVNGGKAWLKQPGAGKAERTYSVSKLWDDKNKRWNLKASRSTNLNEGPTGVTNPPTVQLGDFPTVETALIVMREDGMRGASRPDDSGDATSFTDGLTSKAGIATLNGTEYRIAKDNDNGGFRVIVTQQSPWKVSDITRMNAGALGNSTSEWTRAQAVEAAVARAFPDADSAPAAKTPSATKAPNADNGNRAETAAKPGPKFTGKRADNTSSLTLEEQDRLAQLRARMRDKLKTQMNSGLDPEIVTIAVEMGAIYIKAGARRFRDLVRALMEDMNLPLDVAEPYARVAYNQARGDMELSDQSIEGMDSDAEVIAEIKAMRAEAAAPVAETPNADTAQGYTTDDAVENDADSATQAERDPIGVNDAPVPIEGTLRDRVIEGFRAHFESGGGFKTIVEARKHFEKVTGKEYRPSFAKGLEEAIEVAVVQVARDIAAKIDGPADTYAALVDLYQRQPVLSERTSTSIERQAYSTPAPLAYLASRLAGIEADTSVYEPTAGNGMLLIEAGARLQANELGEERLDGLRRVLPEGATITAGDAMAHSPAPYDVLITNPPFGPVRNGTGKAMSWEMPVLGGKTTQIDHAISAKALAALHEDDGIGVLIIGGQKGGTPEARKKEYQKGAARTFFKKLYDNYLVVSHFTVDGGLYTRQGAGWPVDVIVTVARGKSALPYPMAVPPVLYKSWDELGSYFDGTDNLDTRSREDGSRDGGDGTADRPADAGSVSGRAGVADRPDGARGNAGTGGADSARDGGAVRGSDRGGATDGSGRRDGVRERDPSGSDGDGRSGLADPAGEGQAELGSDAGNDAGRVSGDAVPRKRVERDNTEAETDYQVQYAPRSQAQFAVGTLVPKNMQQAIDRALDDLESRISNQHGNIDAFVAAELEYTLDELLGTEDAQGYFSAEQVDALALAIDNVKQGRGFIIGDQTGVGKGRFVAAMLRWAKINGKVPIFVSKDPGLYADMARDMRDIGMDDAPKRAFLTNNNMRGKNALQLSEDPDDVMQNVTKKPMGEAIAHMRETRRLPEGFDYLFTTYDQMNEAKNRPNPRRGVLEALAPNAMFVLDESHEAGGGKKNERAEKDKPMPRSEFVRQLLAAADAAVFSSATYAKNPDVMSLYAKTDLSLISEDINKLGEIIASGGVPLQQVVSGMLVEAGQYARRERTYEGVSMELEQLTTDTEMAERGAEVIRTLFELDVAVMEPLRNNFVDKAQEEGFKGVFDGAIGKVGMSSSSFASTMHNLAAQFLLAIKVDAVAEKAVALHQKGEKPIIALSNTNASIIAEAAAASGAKVGDMLNVPFNAIVERYLDRLRRITLKDENDDKSYYYLTDADIIKYGGKQTLAAFEKTREAVRKSDLSRLPGSPIDTLLDKMAAAGISVGEITGRQVTLREGVLESREASAAVKKRTMRDFNAGRIDGLVINRSGSTGFSLHALGEKLDEEEYGALLDNAGNIINDAKPRHMIILQPEPNIDLFMQMLGRIHRTGQVRLPGYTIAVSDLSVEKRPAAVLMKKLASLNANTTASKRSAVSIDTVTDFLNAYGDRVVAEYLFEHPSLAAALDIYPSTKAGENVDIASKFTGRLMTQKPADADRIYEEVENAYTSYVESLDRMGINTLEAKVLELEAKLVSSTEIVPARDESSPFGRAAYVEVVDVKRLGKPYTPAALFEQLGVESYEDLTDNLDIEERIEGQIRKIGDNMSAVDRDNRAALAKAEAKAGDANTEKQKAKAQDAIKRARDKIAYDMARGQEIEMKLLELRPGAVGTITVKEGRTDAAFAGVSLGLDLSKLRDDSLAASQIMVRIAVADASREVAVPLSRMMGADPAYNWRPMDDGQYRAVLSAFENGQTDSRERRQMVTGNIPAGFAALSGGQIVLYTTDEGSLKQGILLPRDMNAGARLGQRPAKFANPQQIIQFLKDAPGSRTVYSEDRIMMLTYEGGLLRMAVAAKGANKYIMNQQVRKLVGDFTRRNGQKVYRKQISTDAKFAEILTIYAENLGTTYDTTTDKDAAREITGEAIPTIPGEDQAEARFDIGGASTEMAAAPNEMADGAIRWAMSEQARERADRLGRAINAEFAKSGLPGFTTQVTERLFGRLPGGATFELNGAYYNGAVLVNLTGNQDPMATARHEMVHALRDPSLWGRKYGLFREAEWKALERAAAKDPRLDGKAALYEGEDGAVILEEVIADMYAEWVAGRQQPKGFLKAAFQRIKETLAALRRALKGEGFDGPDAVFRRVQSGEVGGRGPDGPGGGQARDSKGRFQAPDTAPRFAIRPEQERRNAAVSAVVGEDVTHAVTPGTPAQARQESFLKAIASQPIDQAFRIPFAVVGGLDKAGRWKPGKWAEDKLAHALTEAPTGFLSPLVERARAGLIDRYGLDPAYVERERRRNADEQHLAMEGVEHLRALASANLSRDEYAVLQAVLTGDDVPDAQMAKLSEPIRQAIDALGGEAVDLGLISEESYERNRGKYLHRVYAKYEAELGAGARAAEKFMQGRRTKIIGKQFKGRGLFEQVESEKILRDNLEFLEAKRGLPQKGDKLRLLVLKRGDGTDPLDGMESPKGRTVRKVWWPADRPVPPKLDNFEDRGVFEMRGTKGGKIVMWRDFTKDERLRMGEILDARYTIGKTYSLMSHDLANGRLFKDIALNPAWAQKDVPPEARGIDTDPTEKALLKRLWRDPETEWVRVPDVKIPKSDTFKYGQLAGMYVRAEIWRDMEELRAMHSKGFWATLLREWKLNKTIRNPVVHMNNVMSNFILMDMADVRMPDLIAGIRSMYTGDQDFQEASLNGAFGADLVTQELRDNVLKPMLDELQAEARGGMGHYEAKFSRLRLAGKMADLSFRGIKWADRQAMNAYQVEDQVFRMATYLRRKQQGFSVDEAAIEARDQFLNYDIRAPWVNAARRTVLPFLAYTYRAAPKVAQAVLERPWKIAKYALLLQVANAMAYAIAPSDDDEEEERASLRKGEQGLTWLKIPFTDYGVERMVRMPWLAEDGRPVFLDIRRWIPVGDIFDQTDGDLPPPLRPGGPLMIGAELALNKNAFFDKQIWSEYDTFGQRMLARADHLWKGFAPQNVLTPFSWYQEKIGRAERGALDWTGEAYSVSEAWLSSFGIKVKPHSVAGGFEGWQIEFDTEERVLRGDLNRAKRHYSRGLISEKAFKSEVEDYRRKMDGLNKRRREIFETRR